MGTGQVQNTFINELRKALHYLYDPVNLRKNLLAPVLVNEKQLDPGLSLRTILIEGIEALKPFTSVPPHAEAWRIYNILLRRYIEQFSQQEVAREMNLSERHVRREEANALAALALHLWAEYDLELRWPGEQNHPDQPLKKTPPIPDGMAATPSPEQELDFLQSNLAIEPVILGDMIESLLQTVQPLAQAARVQIRYNRPEEIRILAIKPTIVRQAFLISISSVISSLSSTEIRVDVAIQEEQAALFIHAHHHAGMPPMAIEESLQVIRQLMAPSGGSLEALADEGEYTLKMILPLVGRVSVLVIDDNNDTLLLLQRYLTGTRYQFIGTRDSEQGLELASRTLPQVIILDVMMPGIDGWELLGRLREHPLTRAIPVVVCTILPQENLALTLGAAAFLRKPVNRETFLAVLDRLADPSPRGSG